MNTEDRGLRLENAFASLEELAARSGERNPDLEKHFKMLTQLSVSASERADSHPSWINSLGTRMEELAEAQKQTDAHLASLAEAQKQTETRLSSLVEAQRQTETHLSALADSQRQTDVRLSALGESKSQIEAQLSVLAEIVSDLGRAQTRTESALTRVESALASLTERFEQYISSRP